VQDNQTMQAYTQVAMGYLSAKTVGASETWVGRSCRMHAGAQQNAERRTQDAPPPERLLQNAFLRFGVSCLQCRRESRASVD
jgi:hypothetical protein